MVQAMAKVMKELRSLNPIQTTSSRMGHVMGGSHDGWTQGRNSLCKTSAAFLVTARSRDGLRPRTKCPLT